jgi:hypothetical protein
MPIVQPVGMNVKPCMTLLGAWGLERDRHLRVHASLAHVHLAAGGLRRRLDHCLNVSITGQTFR